jgi:hypothetical protein
MKVMIKNMSKIIVIVLSSFMLLSFTSNKNSYQIQCINLDTDGYVILKIWNTQKGTKYIVEQAYKDAIDAILFSGLASEKGCTSQPPILNEQTEKEKFKIIQKQFFSKNGKWSTFAKSAKTETTLPTNLGIKNWKVYQVAISKNELRKYLEEEKIIKSLNNGF